MQFLCRYSRHKSMQAIKNSNSQILLWRTCLLFGKAAVLAYVIAQIASTHYIYYKIQVVSVFECIMHINQKPKNTANANLRVLELGQKLFFIHYWIYGALWNDPRLCHLFHSVELSLLSLFNFPNLAESSAADHILEVKVVFINSCIWRVSWGQWIGVVGSTYLAGCLSQLLL